MRDETWALLVGVVIGMVAAHVYIRRQVTAGVRDAEKTIRGKR